MANNTNNTNQDTQSQSNEESEDEQSSVHKIQRTGRAGMSYMVTLPKEVVKELGWRERQKVEIRKDGDQLIVSDWEEE
jgi:bifunctional DNA-binding transcriptional regulator/antitoxin component of YhaV-PrlF toxin-antitoxin module